MTRVDSALLSQLNANSESYRDPLAEMDWAALSVDDYWLPPSMLSLAGLPEFEALAEATKKRLSQYEFIHFIHGGLWLERIFMERLARALRRTEGALEYAAHLHEIREESGHSLMFLKLMERSGLHLPARAFRVPRLADFVGRHAPLDSALFWTAVVIGEELPDKFNRRVRGGADEVNPAIARMCMLHMIDEARHIARARSVLENALQNFGALKRRLAAPLIQRLLGQFVRTLYLPQAEIYELAGLAPGRRWREAARGNPARRQFVRQCVEPTLNLLRRQGLAIRLPKL
jgi:hypothetical protein